MEPGITIVLAVLAALVVPVGLLASKLLRHSMIDACGDVGKYLGLGVEVPRWPSRQLVVAGTYRGCTVRLQLRLPSLSDWGPAVPAELTVNNGRPIEGLCLRRRHGAFPTDDRFQIGDPAFDRHVRLVAEDIGAARAVLHSDTRSLVTRVVGSGRCEIHGGRLTWKQKVRSDPQVLLHFVQRGVQIARRMACPVDPVDRLAHLVWSKDPPSVRHNAARALAEYADQSVAAHTTLRKIIHRSSPAMQLDAIRALGPSQVDRAVALAQSQAIADHTRASALNLVCHLEPVAAAKLVASVLSERAPPRTRMAAIEQAAELNLRETWPALSTLCADAQYVSLASRALADLGAVEAEPNLLQLLRTGPAACRPALVATLRTLGTHTCVPVLTELTQDASVNPQTRRAAERALIDIEQRLAPEAAGAVP